MRLHSYVLGMGMAISSLLATAPAPAISRANRTGLGVRSVQPRQRGKWSGADLRAIRARNGIGRPPVKG